MGQGDLRKFSSRFGQEGLGTFVGQPNPSPGLELIVYTALLCTPRPRRFEHPHGEDLVKGCLVL